MLKVKLPSSHVLRPNPNWMERWTTYNPNTSYHMYCSINYSDNDTLIRICRGVGLHRPEVCYLYLDHLVESHFLSPYVDLLPT
jgi:hypothetical protein